MHNGPIDPQGERPKSSAEQLPITREATFTCFADTPPPQSHTTEYPRSSFAEPSSAKHTSQPFSIRAVPVAELRHTPATQPQMKSVKGPCRTHQVFNALESNDDAALHRWRHHRTVHQRRASITGREARRKPPAPRCTLIRARLNAAPLRA